MSSHYFSTRFDTPLGEMIACFRQDHLIFLDFSDSSGLNQRLQARTGDVNYTEDPQNPVGLILAEELRGYFEGTSSTFSTPLDLGGTVFQRRIWETLKSVNFGETLTYGALAQKLGNPALTRAAAAACGQNPCLILIPCHRIVGRQGNLTGYRGGLERKKHLLALESRQNFVLRG